MFTRPFNCLRCGKDNKEIPIYHGCQKYRIGSFKGVCSNCVNLISHSRCICFRCFLEFPSRNTLFKHLHQSQHYQDCIDPNCTLKYHKT